jgi:hypothetical protein
MLFLIPQTQDCATSSNYSPMTGRTGETDTDERRKDEQGSNGGTYEISRCRKQQRESNTSPKINTKQQLLDSPKEKSEHTDKDKTFLLSLKNLKNDQKYRAKVKMLGIMRKAKIIIFQPQDAQCFTATTALPHTYNYNLVYQNTWAGIAQSV